MNADERANAAQDVDALRRAFAARAVAQRDDCPSADELYEAVVGQLAAPRSLAVIDHVTGCANCAEAWRLAIASEPAIANASTSNFGTPSRWLLPLSAAAGVALTIGLLFNFAPPATTDDGLPYRAVPEDQVLGSLVGPTLPRDAVLLLWKASAADASYTLRVTTATLEPLLIAENLQAPQHLVPAVALQSVGAGEDLLWQVEALLPDGRRQTSPTYSLRVQ